MTEWEQRYFERVIIIMSHIHHDSGDNDDKILPACLSSMKQKPEAKCN